MNVQWSVHWGCNYHELLALLTNPSSVHLIGAYCRWRGLTKDPLFLMAKNHSEIHMVKKASENVFLFQITLKINF